jgi:hypothetical protein
MLMKFFSFVGILLLLPTSNGIHVDTDVGSTSMDSTHYDRRLLQQKQAQCFRSNEHNDVYHRETFWTTARSLSLAINNSNTSQWIPFRRQLILNIGDERLVTRTSSNNVNGTRTNSLGIDQASVDIIVDKQVSIRIMTYNQIRCTTNEFIRMFLDYWQFHCLCSSHSMFRLSL